MCRGRFSLHDSKQSRVAVVIFAPRFIVVHCSLDSQSVMALPEPDGDLFVKQLTDVPHNVFLMIAANWDSRDIVNIEKVWPQQLADRVSFAFEHCEKGVVDDLATIERLGVALKHLVIYYSELPRNRAYRAFVSNLATNCPNIEQIEVYDSEGIRRMQTYKKFLADYADKLSGNCKLRTTGSLSFSYYSTNDQLRLLRNCNQLEEIVCTFNERDELQVTDELTKYAQKTTAKPVKKLHLCSNSESRTRFSIKLLDIFRQATVANLRLLYPRDAPAELITAVNQHPNLKKVSVQGSIVSLDQLHERLTTDAHITMYENPVTPDVVASLRKKRFEHLKRVRVDFAGGDVIELLNDAAIFPALRAVDLFNVKSSDNLIAFLRNRGHLVRSLRSIDVDVGRWDMVEAVANHCDYLEEGTFIFETESTAKDFAPLQLDWLEKLDMIQPTQCRRQVQLVFADKAAFECAVSLYEQLDVKNGYLKILAFDSDSDDDSTDDSSSDEEMCE